MSEAGKRSYAEIPYSDYVFPYTHPTSMGAVATLLGMRPADPARCRVLELGCGTGANLIPMAYDLPGSEFVGIDLSPGQIEGAKRTVAALGLTNIDLRPGSILEVDESFGRFDYIICHGVYSWVAADVREAILSVCNANLAPDGVAYVSYNTYPGWHFRGMIRDMMTFHVRQFDDPAERVRQARGVLKFLADAIGTSDSLHSGLLRRETELLDKASDAYLYHDYLEEVNAPVYFHEFAGQASARGLQYLTEAQPTPLAQNLSPESRDALQRFSGSLVQAEQYLDFIRNRTFRRSLLCHDHVRLRRPPRGEAITPLYLTGAVRPAAQATQAAAAKSEEFRAPDGSSMWTDYPALRAALRCLFEALPAALAFEALWQRVRARVPNIGGDSARAELAEALLQCYLAAMVELHLRPPAIAVEAGEKPRASALARLQAAAGQPLCNLRHRVITLDPFDRLVLQQLDGTHDRPALVEALANLITGGALRLEHGGAVVRDLNVARGALPQLLRDSLDRISRSALLTAEGLRQSV